jgi:Sap, sulfolipid-1-addressing protein
VNTGNLFEEAAGLAVLAAFYPPAMLLAALYLGSERPGRMTIAYVAGGLGIVTVIGVAALIAIRAGGLSHIGHHQTRYGLRLGLGVVAIVAAVVMWRRRSKPRDPAKPKKPSLIERLAAKPSPWTALAVGVVMFGPSLTFVAAVQVVGTAKAGLADTIGAMAMIIVLTVAFAWLPLLAYAVAPVRTVRTLRAFDGWLKRHGKTVVTIAVGVVGVFLVIQGITGLA